MSVIAKNLIKKIKDRIYALHWFYHICHQEKLLLLQGDKLWETWHEIPKECFDPESIKSLKANLDPESCDTIDNFIKNLIVDLSLREMVSKLSGCFSSLQ